MKNYMKYLIILFVCIIAFSSYYIGTQNTVTNSQKQNFKVFDKNYSLEEIDKKIALQTQYNQIQQNNARRQFLVERLLAFKATEKGLVVNEYLDNEITFKIKVSDEEINDFFKRVKKEQPNIDLTEDVKQRIKNQITQEKKQLKYNKFIDDLILENNQKWNFPAVYKINLENNKVDTVKIGSFSKPFNITVIMDYELLESKTYFEKTIYPIMSKNKSTFNLVVRFFPNPISKNGKTLVKAAFCSNKQNQFIPFSKKMFNREKFNQPDFDLYLTQLNMNKDNFNNCLKSSVADSFVENELEIVKALNLNGLPITIIDGVFYRGALTEQTLETLISDSRSN